MLKTPNLGLTVTDESTLNADADVFFRAFRRRIAGNIPESNMHILDAEVHRLAVQTAQLRAISSGSARYFIRANENDEGALQVVSDEVNPAETQVRISDVGIEGIEVGDHVLLITLDPDGMAELLDIRNTVRGEVRASAGDAVRAVERALLDLESGVNLNGTRNKQIFDSYTDDEIELKPGTRYFLHNIPAALTIVLDDTRDVNDAQALPIISQEFTFVLHAQETPYEIELEYSYGDARSIVWQHEPNFDHTKTHIITVMDGIAFANGGGTGGACNCRCDSVDTSMDHLLPYEETIALLSGNELPGEAQQGQFSHADMLALLNSNESPGQAPEGEYSYDETLGILNAFVEIMRGSAGMAVLDAPGASDFRMRHNSFLFVARNIRGPVNLMVENAASATTLTISSLRSGLYFVTMNAVLPMPLGAQVNQGGA